MGKKVKKTTMFDYLEVQRDIVDDAVVFGFPIVCCGDTMSPEQFIQMVDALEIISYNVDIEDSKIYVSTLSEQLANEIVELIEEKIAAGLEE